MLDLKRFSTLLCCPHTVCLFSSGHYGKENLRSGGQDLHNFISSGFVTLGRGHLKGKVRPHYLLSLHSRLKIELDYLSFPSQGDGVMLSFPFCQTSVHVKTKSNDVTVTFVSVEVGHRKMSL